MGSAEILQLGSNRATLIRLDDDELAGVPERLGLQPPRPVLVVVGGAAGMSEEQTNGTATVFRQVIVPFVARCGLVVVDGGTDYGVMQAIGSARATLDGHFALVGVVVEAIVHKKTEECGFFPPPFLEPNHSHFVFTPGSAWGDEAPFIARLATQLAGGAPSLTLLINGGAIALQDAAFSVEEGRKVVVFEGSGRTADSIAQTTTGQKIDRRVMKLASSGLLRVINPYREPERLRAELEQHFQTSG